MFIVTRPKEKESERKTKQKQKRNRITAFAAHTIPKAFVIIAVTVFHPFPCLVSFENKLLFVLDIAVGQDHLFVDDGEGSLFSFVFYPYRRCPNVFDFLSSEFSLELRSLSLRMFATPYKWSPLKLNSN